jgi:hypothetical protein
MEDRMEVEQIIYFHDTEGKIRMRGSDLKDEVIFFYDEGILKTKYIKEPVDKVEEIIQNFKKIKLTDAEKALLPDLYTLNPNTRRFNLIK